jgi:hypothetical protein
VKLNLQTLLTGLVLAGLLTLTARAQAQDPKPRDVNAIVTNQRLKQLTTVLTLNDEQKEKLRPVLHEEVKSIRAIRETENLTMQEKFAKEKDVRDASKAKAKPILTAEQFAKWEEWQKKTAKRP